MKTPPSVTRVASIVLGTVLGLAALGIYGSTVPQGAYPGGSAELIVQQTGLVPVISPRFPLWRAAAWLLKFIPAGDLPLRLNLFSALCGVLVVWLLHATMVRAIHVVLEDSSARAGRAFVAKQAAGVAAAVALMVSVPFWCVSNRAHTGAFDLLLLVACAWLLLRYHERGRLRDALALVLLFGAGLAELATMIVFAPLLAVALVYCLWSHESLRPGPIAGLTVAFLAAASSVYLLAAWAFHGSPGYALRDYSGFLEIVWHMWREQYGLITSSLPREGWLIILFVSVVPWLACLVVARRGINDERDYGSAILHVVLTALALGVLLNSRFSPWAILGGDRLLVTPYLLTSMLYGYLTAYWFLLPTRWIAESDRRGAEFLRRCLGPALAIPLLGVLVWTGIRNAPEANARRGGLVDAYASRVVDALRGRTWLVTDGVIDNHILLAAYERDVPLRLISASPYVNSVYLKYVGTLFDDPQLKNLAALGTLPLLAEWMSRDPDIAGKLAVLDLPDLWVSAGYSAIPSGLVYFGGAPGATVPGDIVAQQADVWAYMSAMSDRRDTLPADVRRLVDEFYRHTGVLANNLGVALESESRHAEAEACYRQARRLSPDNVSALLNLAVMVREKRIADDGGAIQQAMDRLAEESKGRYRIWSLSRYYGYVRVPEAFADLGWTWAQSGRPELAQARMAQALSLAGADNRAGLQRMMAGVLLLQGDADESAEILEKLVAENPKDVRSLLGLARVELRRGGLDVSENLLRRAEEAGADANALVYDRARLAMARGKTDEAREALTALIRQRSEDPELWALLAEVALLAHDFGRAGDHLGRLEQLEGPRGFRGAVLRGRMALMQSDLERARHEFEAAAQIRPNDVPLMDMLLRICVALRQQGAVWHYAREILKRDRNHAFALNMLGLLRVGEGRLDLAEAALRRSLEIRRTPAILNDLAWTLCLLKQYEEAERLIRECLAQNAANYAYQDTLGTILMRVGRHAEAAEAFEKALALYQRDLQVHVKMAECQAVLGNRDRARSLLDALAPFAGALSEEDRESIVKVRRLLE